MGKDSGGGECANLISSCIHCNKVKSALEAKQEECRALREEIEMRAMPTVKNLREENDQLKARVAEMQFLLEEARDVPGTTYPYSTEVWFADWRRRVGEYLENALAQKDVE